MNAQRQPKSSPSVPEWVPDVPPGLQHLVDQGLLRPPTRPKAPLPKLRKPSEPWPFTSEEAIAFERGD